MVVVIVVVFVVVVVVVVTIVVTIGSGFDGSSGRETVVVMVLVMEAYKITALLA